MWYTISQERTFRYTTRYTIFQERPERAKVKRGPGSLFSNNAPNAQKLHVGIRPSHRETQKLTRGPTSPPQRPSRLTRRPHPLPQSVCQSVRQSFDSHHSSAWLMCRAPKTEELNLMNCIMCRAPKTEELNLMTAWLMCRAPKTEELNLSPW